MESNERGRTHEEHIEAIRRHKIDKTIFKTELKLFKLINDLHNAGITLITLSTCASGMARLLRSSRAFQRPIPDELFRNTQKAAQERERLHVHNLKSTYIQHLKAPFILFVPR